MESPIRLAKTAAHNASIEGAIKRSGVIVIGRVVVLQYEFPLRTHPLDDAPDEFCVLAVIDQLGGIDPLDREPRVLSLLEHSEQAGEELLVVHERDGPKPWHHAFEHLSLENLQVGFADDVE